MVFDDPQNKSNNSKVGAEKYLEEYPPSSGHGISTGSDSVNNNADTNSVVAALPKIMTELALNERQDPAKAAKEKEGEQPEKSDAEIAKEMAESLTTPVTEPNDIGGLHEGQRYKLKAVYQFALKKAEAQEAKEALAKKKDGKEAQAKKKDAKEIAEDAEKQFVARIQAEITKGGSKSTFNITSDEDKEAKTVTKSYELTNGETGKKKTLFVTSFDQHGEEIKPRDFIASKLADGNVTATEKRLIETALRAMYRDNAVGASPETYLQHGFCLGSLYDSSQLEKINKILGSAKPDAGPLTSRGSAKSPTTRVYEFQGKPLLEIELDPEQKDQDIDTAKWYTKELLKGPLSDENKTYFNHALVSAYERYKEYGIPEVIKSVEQQLKQQNPDSRLEQRVVPNEPKRITYNLYNGNTKTRSKLCDIDLNDAAAVKKINNDFKKLIGFPEDNGANEPA